MYKLLKMATEFEMIVNAGLMKVDENDFQTVFNWVEHQFCCNVKKTAKQSLENILESIDSSNSSNLNKWVVSFNLLLNHLVKYNENDIEQTTSFKLNSLTDPLFVSWTIGDPNELGFTGLFTHDANSIELVFDTYKIGGIDYLKKELISIKGTLKHELQHAIQFDYRHYSEKEVGYPSDKIRNYNMPGTNWFNNKLKKIDPTKPDDIIYYQRDEEFYPQLETDVKLFNRDYKNLPETIKQMAIKVWVGEVRPPIDNTYELRLSNFFTSLKKQPDIWKKAVKEFYKAVN